MKLNWNCFNDALLTIEKTSQMNTNSYQLDNIRVSKIISQLSQYSADDVAYCLIKLTECNYIDSDIIINADRTEAIVHDVTFLGHEYLRDLHHSNH